MKKGKVGFRKCAHHRAKEMRDPTAAVSQIPVRPDYVGHFPEPMCKKERCKRPNCREFF